MELFYALQLETWKVTNSRYVVFTIQVLCQKIIEKGY